MKCTSAPILMASWKLAAPTGRIMNSCMASLLPAWLPPLITLKACKIYTYLKHYNIYIYIYTHNFLYISMSNVLKPHPLTGTGRITSLLPARSAMWRYRGTPFSAAPALHTASDTPRMALAPNLATHTSEYSIALESNKPI